MWIFRAIQARIRRRRLDKRTCYRMLMIAREIRVRRPPGRFNCH
jgi:hypothetical protein